ncbi:MAG: CapA family protein [Dorea sp.]|jgi:poly-gamma-glutamate capsule biosynthesis protein CapA/YwtB (metallophosphatase superfamily)|nr:CapA family protein [Dorea sp.]
MEDYSERRPKKDGIKAHKAAQQKRADRFGKSGRSFDGARRSHHGGGTVHERYIRRDMAEGEVNREARRRLQAERQKKRQKRQFQRLTALGALTLVLVLSVLFVRVGVKGVWKKATEAKAKAEALELEKKKPKLQEATAVITVAGDVIMHQPLLESSVYYNGESYDYNPIFTYMKEIYEAADFAAVTTEYALTEGGYSGYPLFCAPDAIAEAMAANGLDMCMLANNHIYDNGDEGLQRTMDVLEKNHLLYIGIRKNETDKNYVVQDINGIKVGFFNYVYETKTVGGTKTINGISVGKASENLINSFQEAEPQFLYDDIEKNLAEMKEEGVEYTVAFMHWGVEYQTKENSYQDAIAQELCDLGIDALIASHPHVIEPVDLLESGDGKHKMVCAYAIGNHLSNQRTEYMDGLVEGYSEDGMVVTLAIHRDKDGKITLERADFTPTWVYHDKDPDDEYFILPLGHPEEVIEAAGFGNIEEDIEQSLERTNRIVGEGVQKIQEALPLKQ